MSEPAVVMEIGGASPGAGEEVNVRQVYSRDQSQGGKAGFAVQPGLAQGNGGKGVGEIIHGGSENLKFEASNEISKRETGKSKMENGN
jgi:hypothetical protein